KMSDMMETSTLSVKYEKKPSTIVEFSQSLLEGFKGGGKAIYQLTEESIQMIVDFPATFRALESMIAHPIDTAKYIGHAIIDSFNRDVIHGDSESRGKWFTYAVVSIFGFKGVGKVGKAGTEAAKKGAQKTGQMLEELLPYHPKHQLAIDGPVPYNVYDGVNLKDQSMVQVENVSGNGIMSGDKSSGKGTDNGVPSYGKKSVPIGPYREVNEFSVRVKPGAQEKHIPNTPNYKQEIANGKSKSIFYGDNKTAQELLDKFAGKGTTVTKNKERVDFGKPIGKYYDIVTGQYIETNRGMIHYGKDGAHIVPAKPSE